MRIRPWSVFAPALIAGSMLVISPAPALADNGMTETGTTTYEVVPSKNLIAVTVKISVHNTKPDTATAGGYYYYFWNQTGIVVEKQASKVSATSNAGSVSQKTTSTDQYYRYITLNYPNVYYGQTRVVTATYTIPAGPEADGGFRAGSAYASLCASGNGLDTGSLSVVVPAGFDLHVDDGDDLKSAGTSGGKQVFSSGTQASPYKLWTCIDAEDQANLTHSTLTADGQAFSIEGWPEDTAWSTEVQDEVSADVPALENLTGLKMPGGTIVIMEAGDMQLGQYGGEYDWLTTTAGIPQTAEKDVVAHELSHIWFNPKMLFGKWMDEGLAGYSEKVAGTGNYTPCKEPGAYPGAGSPNLTEWMVLTNSSTTQDQNVLDWQYAASCYIFTSLADATGPNNFKAVLEAVAADDMAYVGADPNEHLAGVSGAVTAEQLLDIIDQRGMVPAGVTDLDQAQNLMARFGIFDAATLGDRAKARADYQTLAKAAGKWTLPLAIRGPMTTWDFTQAETAMTTATQIVGVRDSIQSLVPGFSLNGTAIEQKFESAATQADLNDLLAQIKKEAAAAGKLDQATKLKNGSLSVLQTLGLMGTNLNTELTAARSDLQNMKPDDATTEAQSVIDSINGSSSQGVLRGGVAAAGLAILLLLVFLLVVFGRRKRAAGSTGPGAGLAYTYPPGGGLVYPAAPGGPVYPPAPGGGPGYPPSASVPGGGPGYPAAPGGPVDPPAPGGGPGYTPSASVPGGGPGYPAAPGGPVDPPAPGGGPGYTPSASVPGGGPGNPYPPGGFDPNTGAPLWSAPVAPPPVQWQPPVAPEAPAPVQWQPPVASPADQWQPHPAPAAPAPYVAPNAAPPAAPAVAPPAPAGPAPDTGDDPEPPTS